MQVRIRYADCSGNGECVQLAPDVFALGSKNKVTVLDPEAASPELLVEAAEACPCQAIEILDDEGQVVFP